MSSLPSQDKVNEVLALSPHEPVQTPFEEAESIEDPRLMLKHANHSEQVKSTLAPSPAKAPSIARYFGIDSESDISPEISQLLSDLGQSIFPETKDADEIFMFMKAAEKAMPDITDPITRITRLTNYFNQLSPTGIKKHLTESGLLHIDDAEEYGRQSGNWTRALKLARAHAQSVRL